VARGGDGHYARDSKSSPDDGIDPPVILPYESAPPTLSAAQSEDGEEMLSQTGSAASTVTVKRHAHVIHCLLHVLIMVRRLLSRPLTMRTRGYESAVEE